jgi:hypothetical protein
MGRQWLARVVKRWTRARSTKFSFSCDDAEPFHFSIKPYAVNNQRDSAEKGSDRSGEINWSALDEIDPDAPRAATEREQRRKKDENYVETFQ